MNANKPTRARPATPSPAPPDALDLQRTEEARDDLADRRATIRAYCDEKKR